MMLIPCPWCGPRDEDEFVNGGEAHPERPRDPGELSDADWTAYLFFHDNPKGPLAERWTHAYGCRQVFIALRDTFTHQILESRPL